MKGYYKKETPESTGETWHKTSIGNEKRDLYLFNKILSPKERVKELAREFYKGKNE